MQLSQTLIKELYEEAQTNGFNAQEYLLLLTGVDNMLNRMSTHTQEHLKGIKPADYDISGREVS